MINFRDFKRLYAKTFKTTREEADYACNSVFQLLSQLLYEDKEDVAINKFGTFKKTSISGKNFRHPTSGELHKSEDKVVIKFKQSDNPMQINKEDEDA